MRRSLGQALAMVLVSFALLQSCPLQAAKPYIETGPGAERSFDGLYRVKRSRMGAAWVREGMDLSRYDRLMVHGVGIAYRPVESSGSSSMARRRGATDFPISPENREKLSVALREEVMDELAKGKRFQLTDEAGEGVLLLVGGLIDVVSHVPPEGPGRNDVYLDSVGEATLVLELRDSLTGAIIARAADRRAASSPWLQESNPVVTRSEVGRLGSSWGRLLRDRLDDLMSMSGQIQVGKP
jgi:hypothetical protein